MDLCRVRPACRRTRASADGARRRERGARGNLVHQSRRVDADAVRNEQARSDSRQREPELSGIGTRIRAESVRMPLSDPHRRVQDDRLQPDSREHCAGDTHRRSGETETRARAATGSGDYARRTAQRHAVVGGRARARRRGLRGRARTTPARTQFRRPDQHSVHQRYDRVSERRHAQPPQHSEQRLLRRAADELQPP